MIKKNKNEKCWIHIDPYIAWKIIETIDFILDTHSTECAWQVF